MQNLTEQFLAQIAVERRRLSRRRFLSNASALAGGAVALGLSARVSRAQDSTPASGMMGEMEPFFADDIEVLNYALTLEHLEASFYTNGVPLFAYGTDGFGLNIADNLAAIRDHEVAHVETLTQVITDLGGEPVAPAPSYNFDDAYANVDSFLVTAAAIENLGVAAYDGAAQFIKNVDLLTAAGSIVAVEARHASYLNLITGEIPFPLPFELPQPPEAVLETAGPFIGA